MMRDNAIFRHTIQDRGHPERMRSAPRGGTAAEGADIPPQGTAQAQARKIGAAWADPKCALVALSFWGGSLGPLFSPVWGLHLGTRPPARVDHDDVEAPPPFPVWDNLPRGANRAPVDFA